MTNTPVELHHEDFDDSDRDLVWLAGAHLVIEAGDLVHHHSDGQTWAPWPQDNTAELAQQARELIDHMDRALTQARRHLAQARSEEHTSELQSRENLVCRPLLEKKK